MSEHPFFKLRMICSPAISADATRNQGHSWSWSGVQARLNLQEPLSAADFIFFTVIVVRDQRQRNSNARLLWWCCGRFNRCRYRILTGKPVEIVDAEQGLQPQLFAGEVPPPVLLIGLPIFRLVLLSYCYGMLANPRNPALHYYNNNRAVKLPRCRNPVDLLDSPAQAWRRYRGFAIRIGAWLSCIDRADRYHKYQCQQGFLELLILTSLMSTRRQTGTLKIPARLWRCGTSQAALKWLSFCCATVYTHHYGHRCLTECNRGVGSAAVQRNARWLRMSFHLLWAWWTYEGSFISSTDDHQWFRAFDKMLGISYWFPVNWNQ